MAERTKTEDERFLNRWARLKQEEQAVAAVEPLAAELPEDVSTDEPPPDLPDIDSLDKDSDFTVFLGDKVPDALRNAALRKLWRSDPVFANLDGLNDYDEDFAAAFKLTGDAIKTIMKPGPAEPPSEPEQISDQQSLETDLAAAEDDDPNEAEEGDGDLDADV
jgi:hypothetical protein